MTNMTNISRINKQAGFINAFLGSKLGGTVTSALGGMFANRSRQKASFRRLYLISLI